MSQQPRHRADEPERNLAGMPPKKDRQRPGRLDKTRTAWSRGDGGMEGPAGWHSEFGRAGFASTGERPDETPEPTSAPNVPEPSPTTAPKPENRVQQGAASDSWDRPYGDASWGGQAVKPTPEEERRVNASVETAEARDAATTVARN